MNPFRRLISMAVSMAYPDLCPVCSAALVQGEKCLCLKCLAAMPRTFSHRDPAAGILSRLAPVCPVKNVASWFYYDPGGTYSRLIMDAKYNDMPLLAMQLGELFARELTADGFFDTIDLIVPVPLHWTRRLARGYNQSRRIALGISRVTGIPLSDNLFARRPHKSQTSFSRERRLANVRGVFALRHAGVFSGHHILLVDDIITSGATMESALTAIMAAIPPASVSLLSLGLTREHVR